MSCNCSACKAEKAVMNGMSILPTFTCSSHTSWMADYCHKCQASQLSDFILIVGMGQKSLIQDYLAALPWEKKYVLEAALSTGIRYGVPQAYFGVLAAYGAYAPNSSVFSGSDYFCNECDMNVSKLTDPSHWDLICGDCNNHAEGEFCQKCPDCDYHVPDCACCETCGNAPGYCECCSYCEMPQYDCECESCEDCGYVPASACGCSNTPYRFGSSKEAPWLTSTDSSRYAPMSDVLSMSDLDQGVDPVRSAADFYLLEAIVGMTRMSEASIPEANAALWADRDRIIRNDDMLSAILVSAKRSHAELVERLDRSFLAYAVSACGGELRYHRAISGDVLSGGRSSAWDQWVEIVKEYGPSVLFDAADLFEEFGSSSYGGHKWAVAAKIVGQRLSGNMPAWLYVDRMFTLEHNGGCFLNKASWSVSNELGYGLHHMGRVLDAHAGLCSKCNRGAKSHPRGEMCEDSTTYTGYDLLCKVASPGVRQMFQMAETRVSRIVRRFGGDLPALVRSDASKQDRQRPCPWCGYYACVC